MYDLAVIGGGPAGYVAAAKAGAAGMSVVLFEKEEVGGVCLNEGCIPTKTLLYSAKLLENAVGAAKYGVEVPEARADVRALAKRKDKVVKKLVGGVKVQLRDAGVTVVKEAAAVKSYAPGKLVIESASGAVEAARLLICTGSVTVIPPIPGIEGNPAALSSRELLEINEIPDSLVVIGGGVIGMEFASLFNSLGSRVTVIEMLPKILGPMDDEISAMLQAQYAKKGVVFHLGCKVLKADGNAVSFQTPEGEVQSVEGAKILVSVGRRARLEGLEALPLELNQRPRGIKVNAAMATSLEGVWAAGDVTGFSMLAHTASREAEVAVDNMLGIPSEMRYDAIPSVVYTNPEVAGVGLTEQEASARGTEVLIKKLPMAYSGRFTAENDRGEGLCKILLTPDGSRILGVHRLGNPSSEILPAACLAIENGLGAEAFRQTVFPHPGVAEILKETLK